MSVPNPMAAGSPPVAMRLTGNDRGLLTCYNSVAGATVSLFSRILTFDGKLVEVQQDFSPAATRAAVTQPWEPGDGYLLSLMLATTSTVRRGQLYCRVDLQRGLQTTPLIYATLLNDYVHLGYRPTWPFAVQSAPTAGAGMLRSLNLANPAAGTDWAQSVPTGARWRLRGGTATLVTAVAAGTRQVALIVDDGATTLFTIEAATTQAPSLTQIYSLIPGDTLTTLIATQLPVLIPLDLQLFAGWRIRTSTTTIAGADQWSGINFLVEEWLEP